MKLSSSSFFLLINKIQYKSIKDLNIRHSSLNLVEKKVRNRLGLIGGKGKLSEHDPDSIVFKSNN